jgi:putative transposase
VRRVIGVQMTRFSTAFAAHKTIEIAGALNLFPCFTPVESPESNGMAEAFVKTFKRDYVRVNPIPDAAAALTLIDSWMEDYNTVHPHSRLGYRSPREYILFQPLRVRFDGVNSTDKVIKKPFGNDELLRIVEQMLACRA